MFLFKSRRWSSLEGERIALRLLRRGDLKVIHQWLSDEELMELAFGVANPNSDLYNLLPAYKREIEENVNSFLSIATRDDQMIGFCSHTTFGFEQRARIGILIGDRAYWNRGYGREAVTLLLRHLFVDKKLRTIELDTAFSNVRAQRCFESCGFAIIHKDWCEANGRLWYEIDRDQFLGRVERSASIAVPGK